MTKEREYAHRLAAWENLGSMIKGEATLALADGHGAPYYRVVLQRIKAIAELGEAISLSYYTTRVEAAEPEATETF